MSAQAEGEYAEALLNYYQALKLEFNSHDRSFILYNIGLIHSSNGDHPEALDFYYASLKRNPCLPQALNNIAVIYHYRGEKALSIGDIQTSDIFFGRAAEYWTQALTFAPNNYIEAQNWLENRNLDKSRAIAHRLWETNVT